MPWDLRKRTGIIPAKESHTAVSLLKLPPGSGNGNLIVFYKAGDDGRGYINTYEIPRGSNSNHGARGLVFNV